MLESGYGANATLGCQIEKFIRVMVKIDGNDVSGQGLYYGPFSHEAPPFQPSPTGVLRRIVQ